MFTIIGITGNTGAAAADALLSGGRAVRALVRDPARAAAWAARGVELMQGDATDGEALRRAFDGVEGAYLMVPPAPAHPDPIGFYEAIARAGRDAARATGLPRLVLLSSEGAQQPAGTGPILGLHRAEAILAGAAGRTTVLRATYFLENWRALLPLAAAEGILPTMLARPAENRALVGAAGIGRIGAELLSAATAPAVVELSGPEDHAVEDVAAAFAAALGHAVGVVQPPREAWEGILAGAGLGPANARLIGEMYDGINGGIVRFSGAAEARRGRVTLREAVAAWAASLPATRAAAD